MVIVEMIEKNKELITTSQSSPSITKICDKNRNLSPTNLFNTKIASLTPCWFNRRYLEFVCAQTCKSTKDRWKLEERKYLR